MNNVVLCGFMGCGKSTVGRNLARKTGRKFLDMDRYIEEKAGMSVKEIFERQGEDGFRELEHEACVELSDKKNLIIASGGGALTFDRNVKAFKGKDRIVLLDVPLNTIKYRLRNDKTRPLLQREDKDRAMDELFMKRYPRYMAAADVVVSGQSTRMKTTIAVMEAMKLSF